jgi:sulfur-carrier protein
MAKVRFTSHLLRFFPNLVPLEIQQNTVHQLIKQINERYPGLASYLIEDDGSLRKHVNIFVDGKMLNDRKTLSDELTAHSDVFVAQALSGG